MFRRLIPWGAALIAAVTAACDDGPATVSSTVRSAATWSNMVYASSTGPILVEVRGAPFGSPPAQFREQIAGMMSGQVIGRRVTFTADPAQAPRPLIRVSLAFNPPESADPRQLCDGTIATAAQPAAPGEKITVLAAFCDKDQLLSSVKGWVSRVASQDDPRFRDLMGQVVRDLFGSPS